MSKALALAFVLFNSEPSKDPWWSCRPREFLSLFGLWDAGWDMLKFRSTSAPAEKQKKNRVYSITRFKQVHQLITLSEDYEKSFYLQFQLRIAAPRHMCLARSSSRPLYHCILSRPCHKPWILQPKEEKQKRRIESVLNPLEIKRQGKKIFFGHQWQNPRWTTLQPLLRCRIAQDICTCTQAWRSNRWGLRNSLSTSLFL